MATVKVPQADGEIRISLQGNEATTYKVSDHQVTVKDDDLELFLGAVEGSEVTGKAASAKKEG